jgi:hypothetical protein
LSNLLESSHGYLKDETPQRNSFHVSPDRIVLMPKEQMAMFQDIIQYSFCRSLRQSENQAKCIPAEQMEQECRFYWTSLESCSSGGTVDLAQTHRVKTPCRHEYSLGGVQPIEPKIRLQQDASLALADHDGTHAQRSTGSRWGVHGKRQKADDKHHRSLVMEWAGVRVCSFCLSERLGADLRENSAFMQKEVNPGD